jgi:hypothetical protein
MFTVIETPLFQKQWPLYWSEEERGEFAAHLAQYPNAGDVVPESGGIRKVRWRRAGSGKSGGVRVIYFTRTADEEVVLLSAPRAGLRPARPPWGSRKLGAARRFLETLYAKGKTDNITGDKLKEIRHALES